MNRKPLAFGAIPLGVSHQDIIVSAKKARAVAAVHPSLDDFELIGDTGAIGEKHEPSLSCFLLVRRAVGKASPGNAGRVECVAIDGCARFSSRVRASNVGAHRTPSTGRVGGIVERVSWRRNQVVVVLVEDPTILTSPHELRGQQVFIAVSVFSQILLERFNMLFEFPDNKKRSVVEEVVLRIVVTPSVLVSFDLTVSIWVSEHHFSKRYSISLNSVPV